MTIKSITASAFVTATLISLALSTPALADPQRAQAQANFSKADMNQDQQLNFDEFTTFINLNADHGLGRAGMIRRFGMHGRAFGEVDMNRDGQVTKEEIAARAQQ